VAVEIERKFLVDDGWPTPSDVEPADIRQGYLTEAARGGTEVRVRAHDDRRLMTVKRDRPGDGASVRDEVEFPIEQDVFDQLWALTEGHRVEKARYPVPVGEHTATVDVYSGHNSGLRVVEVEFDSEQAAAGFQPPDWFGDDVSGDPRYANRLLAG
jgi:CYTH domain-containing protein